MDERKIFAIERPHRRLWKLYLIRSILTGPAIFISLPLYWFRYHTLRYSFDEEGIHMRWGILFRLLRGIHEELRGANEALGRLATKEDGDV